MPNVWTHIIFGEKVLQKAGLKLDAKDIRFFRMGTQGPDFFFYHNFLPWAKNKCVAKVGSVIHSQSCGPFLTDMIEYVKEHRPDKGLKAYVAGFVTHHLLDRSTHPYICSRCGDGKNQHHEFETNLDTVIAEQFLGIETWKIPVYKEIWHGDSFYKPAREMLATVIEKHFPEIIKDLPANYIGESYRDMLKALKFLHDPTGWKNIILKRWVSPFSYKKLNEENKKSHPSFLNLMGQAEEEGAKVIALIFNYWENGERETLEQIKAMIGNIAYDTGRPIS